MSDKLYRGEPEEAYYLRVYGHTAAELRTKMVRKEKHNG